MKKFKNKMTFLIFLLGFYAVIAVFTGVVMYLPYMDTAEYYEDEETTEEEESYEDKEYSEDEEESEDEDSYDEEESSSDEDTYEDEESSGDEDTYEDEDESGDEDTYEDEEESEDEDTYEDEDESEDEDTYEDEDESEDEDSYDEEDGDDESANNSIPHTEDVEDGSHDDSVAVPTPIPESTVNNTTSGTTQATTSVASIAATSAKANATSNPFPLSFTYNGKGKLNIRKEPSKSGKIVGTISTNTKGTVLEFTNDEWAKVKYNNTEGYVAYEYIEYTLPEGTVIPSPKPSVMP